MVGLEEAWSLEWLVVSQKEQEMPSVFLPGVRQDSDSEGAARFYERGDV